MSDNQNLPVNVDTENQVGSITYANEVIAIIAGMAMYEIEGVVEQGQQAGIADLFGRAKPMTRGVKVEVGTEETSVDLVMTVEYGYPIQKVATEVQENVRKAIETMTGMHVVKVDVHVIGISFEKETQEAEKGYIKATEGVPAAFDENNGFLTTDTDSTPEGVDPDTLPVRNIHMNDGRTGDECEVESATMTGEADQALSENDKGV